MPGFQAQPAVVPQTALRKVLQAGPRGSAIEVFAGVVATLRASPVGALAVLGMFTTTTLRLSITTVGLWTEIIGVVDGRVAGAGGLAAVGRGSVRAGSATIGGVAIGGGRRASGIRVVAAGGAALWIAGAGDAGGSVVTADTTGGLRAIGGDCSGGGGASEVTVLPAVGGVDAHAESPSAAPIANATASHMNTLPTFLGVHR